jgi:hypothetical protein
MKNRKGEANGFMLIFIAIITILLALAFITSVANTKSVQTDKQIVINESDSLTTCYEGSADNSVNETKPSCNITVASAPTGWELTSSECAIGSVVTTNGTGVYTLVEGTDYDLFAQTGILRLLNTTDTGGASLAGNTTLTSYDYCGNGYLTSSGDRGLMNLIPTLMIIALLIILAGAVYKLFGKE